MKSSRKPAVAATSAGGPALSGGPGDDTWRRVQERSRRGLWLMVAWAVLLFLGTLTHQPPYQTQFAAWSRYVTTGSFLASHLVNSILGAGLGALGSMALGIVLTAYGASRLALWAVATFVLGDVAIVSVFGIAAFGQPAIGRAYLDGDHAVAGLYDDVNGVPLLLTALVGVLLLTAGLVLDGIGLLRTGGAPRWGAWAFIVGGPLFAIIGVILADVVQSVGAALLVCGTVSVALRSGRGAQERRSA